MSKDCGCCCSEHIICQSCGMPLTEDAAYGTNKDGSPNTEYCVYCFKEGTFIEPDLKVEDMIKIGADFLVKEHKMTPEEAAEFIKKIVMPLKRWNR